MVRLRLERRRVAQAALAAAGSGRLGLVDWGRRLRLRDQQAGTGSGARCSRRSVGGAARRIPERCAGTDRRLYLGWLGADGHLERRLAGGGCGTGVGRQHATTTPDRSAEPVPALDRRTTGG